MRAVTVVALRGLHVAQFGNFAVVRFKVGGGDGLMTPPALVHDVETEIREVGALDGVRGVAVATHRQGLGRPGHRGGMHAGSEGLIDSLVAAAAGCGYVLRIHAGARIATRQLLMRRMAIGAVRRHGQATLQQTLAVDAFLVFLHHVGLRPFIPDGRPLPLAVALSAQSRNVSGKGGRAGIVPAQHSMRAVTVHAGGRVRAALGQQLSVSALLKLLHRVGVTNRAIDARRYSGARTQQGRVTADMALHAGRPGMPRFREFHFVNKQPPHLPAAGGFDFRVAVTSLAVAIRHSLRIKYPPDFVRLVAVHTDGDQVRSLLPQLAADDLAMHAFNLRMALRTSPGDVLFGNRRPRVGVGQDEVRRVATGTNCRHDQATAEQALAVDAFRIVFQDLVLRDVVSELDGSAFVMTTATQKGDLGNRGGRTGVGRAQDVVSSVTILAAGGQRVTALRRFPVQAFRMLLFFVGVAGAAVNRLELLGMGELFCVHITVATGALQRGVR